MPFYSYIISININNFMKEKDPKFCFMPFTAFSVSPRGIIRTCCNIYSKKMVDWENVRDITPAIEWPTSNIKKLQNKFLAGDIEKNIPECGKCWDDERAGLPSYRTLYNNHVSKAVENIDQYVENPKYFFLDIQFGHLCNLSCLMCSSSLSSHLQSTKLRLAAQTQDDAQKIFYLQDVNNIPKNMNLDWAKDEASYQKVKKLTEDIVHIKISGGEPLFNPKFKEFLEFLITKEKPIQRIHLTTNGTVYDPDLVSMLNKIPVRALRISLESAGIEDEFIRWPTNWEEKEKNIKSFFSQIEQTKDSTFIICSCIQALNILSLHTTEEYVKNLSTELGKNITMKRQIVGSTSVSSVTHCDDGYLQYYLDNIADALKLEDVTKRVQESIGSRYKQTRKQVLYYMDMAKLNGMSLEKIFPIYWEYHKKYLF